MTWGFLRETKIEAERVGNDRDTGLPRTGLDEYLKVIFPGMEWIHDNKIEIDGIPQEIKRKKPDYRCEALKLIIEFDGIDHYRYPEKIRNDKIAKELYEQIGYKVVRIPYFIQLSNKAVKELFGVDVEEKLFDDKYASMGVKERNTPANLCIEGIKRMAEEFKRFPEQYDTNIKALREIDDDFLTGVSLLEKYYK